jgi:hypothetical protein
MSASASLLAYSVISRIIGCGMMSFSVVRDPKPEDALVVALSGWSNWAAGEPIG